MKNRFIHIMLAAATFFVPKAALAFERSGFFELPNPPTGTGNPARSFSSAGGTPTFVNTMPGEYIVTFPGLAHGSVAPGEGGNVQVSSRQQLMRCNPISWGPSGNDLSVTVDCFNRYGARNNAQFVASYRQMVNPVDAPETLRAYVWNENSVVPAANSLYSFNSTGAANFIGRVGPGSYRVIMPGMYSSSKGGSVMVSAYGTENGQMRSCKVGSWFQVSGTTLGVDVLCFGPGGVPGDSRFTAFYGLNTSNKIGSSAYAWSELATPPPNFTPNLFYQAVLANRSPNTAIYAPSLAPSGNVTITRSAPGFYNVTVPKLNAFAVTNALVTAYGNENANHCSIAGWAPSGLNQVISVACGDPFDTLQDTRFALQFGTSQFFAF